MEMILGACCLQFNSNIIKMKDTLHLLYLSKTFQDNYQEMR